MIVKSIWVDSYGSLRHMAIPSSGELRRGLNVIYGPNEAGKSQVKRFVEEMLFPSPRVPKDSRPTGRIEFEHDKERYLLEAFRNSAFPKLMTEAQGSQGIEVSRLFPTLGSKGNEVFSSLYSFGLDELRASTTNGSALLSEHLFGAVAGGWGASISSVFDELESRIRRFTGNEAKVRSLQKVIENLVDVEKEMALKAASEAAFLQRYHQRHDIRSRIAELENAAKGVSHRVKLCNEVLRMHEAYGSFCDSASFLERHSNLEPMTADILRRIATLFSRLQTSRDAIRDVETDIDATSMQIELLIVDDRILRHADEIRVASKIRDDLIALQRDLLSEVADLDDARSELIESASSIGIKEGDIPGYQGGQTPEFAIESLERAAGTLEALKGQMDQYMAYPLVSASDEALKSRLAEIDAAMAWIGDRIGNSQDHFRSNKISGFGAAGTLIVLWCFVLAALYATKLVPTTSMIVAGTAGFIALALVRTMAANRRNFQNSRKTEGFADGTLAHLGLQLLESRDLAPTLGRLQVERNTIEAVSRLRIELGRLASSGGLSVSPEEPFPTLEYVAQGISERLHLAKAAAELRRSERALLKSRSKLEERKSDLTKLFERTFPQFQLTRDTTVDYLVIFVTKLESAIFAAREILSQSEARQRQLQTDKQTLQRRQGELDGLVRELNVELERLGYSHEDLDLDLMTLFTDYENNRSVKDLFVRSAESVFGDELQTALQLFNSGRVELEELIAADDEERERLNRERDELLRMDATIETEERSLQNNSSLIELQVRAASLRLEAEEITARLRAHLLARNLLRAANTRFEELHQPELLQLSSEIFSRVTHGRYVSVVKREGRKGDAVFIRNRLGEEIRDSELSRGAREQLYISIRLALVSRSNALDLPLLMDDVMVNADIERARGLAEELARISEKRQILYFCAKHDTVRIFEALGTNLKIHEMSRL